MYFCCDFRGEGNFEKGNGIRVDAEACRENTDRKPTVTVDKQPDKPPAEETAKVNPRELNPYPKDNGSSYADGNKASREQLFPSSLVGDGGASWRLKALKGAA